MGPYKNYLGKPRAAAQTSLTQSCHGYKLKWNTALLSMKICGPGMGLFHLGSKLRQVAAVCYAVSVLFANIWTCIRGNLHVPRQL